MNRTKYKNCLFALSVATSLVIGLLLSWPKNLETSHLDSYRRQSHEITIDTITHAQEQDWLTSENQYPTFLSSDDFTSKPQWFRKRIQNNETEKQEFMIQLLSPHVISAEFYRIQNGQNVNIFSWHNNQRDPGFWTGLAPHHLYFPLTLNSLEEVILYAKIGGPVIQPMLVSQTSTDQFENQIINRTFFIALFLGGLIFISLYNFIIFIYTRDHLYWSYGCYHLCLGSYFYLFSGKNLLPQLPFNPAITTTLMGLSLVGFIIFNTQFFRNYLETSRYHPSIDRFMVIFQWISTVIPILLMFLSLQSFIQCSLLLLCIESFMSLALLVFFAEKQHSRIFIVIWLIFLFSVLIHSGSALGILRPNNFTSHMVFFGILLQAIFIAVTTGYKIKEMTREKLSLKTQFILSENASTHTAVNPDTANPEKQSVTILLSDIVGFSDISAKLSVDRVFFILSGIMKLVAETIQKFDGTIDRSLGDGILAVFGQKSSDSNEFSDVDRAFLAAIELQKTIMNRYYNFWMMPTLVRIGIHTDEIHIGNLGHAQRVDYTLIGNGVSFTSLLENSCNPSRIMLSKEVKDRLNPNFYHPSAMNAVWIGTKKRQHYATAFEYDPFFKTQGSIQKKIQKHIEFLGKSRLSDRTYSVVDAQIKLISEFGSFTITDFSLNGYGSISEVYLGKGLKTFVQIEVKDPHITHTLKELMLDEVELEVQWGRVTPNGFRQGFRILGLNRQQKELLLQQLKEALK